MGAVDVIRRAVGSLFGRRDVAPQNPAPGWTNFVRLYGEPNTERVLTSFVDYAVNGYGGNSVVFGVEGARLGMFTEATFCLRDLRTRKLEYSPDLALLENPWPNGQTGDLLARMIQDADLAGNAYVRRLPSGEFLERLRPDWVTIVSRVVEDPFGRRHREVIGYAYEPVGDPERGDVEYYDVSEVSHWAPIPDPVANWRGMSWMTAVLREINADLAMTQHREAWFRNAATPNIFVRYQGRLHPDRLAKVRDAITARHAGPDKAGGTLVLDEGADMTIVGRDMAQSAFTDIQAAGENRIAVASGVPAIVAGLKEGMTAASWSMYTQAVRRFADVTMRPLWRSACGSLAKLVVIPGGKQLWYDTRDVAALQPSQTEAAQAFQVQAVTASNLLVAGYEPDSVTAAVLAGDMSLLVHSGRYSVQLLPPGAPGQPGGDPGRPPAIAATATRGAPLSGWERELLERELGGAPYPFELDRAWNPAHHPRDARGRFVRLGGSHLDVSGGDAKVRDLSSRKLQALFADLLDDDEPNAPALKAVNDELARREDVARRTALARRNPLPEDLAGVSDDRLFELQSAHAHDPAAIGRVNAELAARRRRARDAGAEPLLDWSQHGADTTEQRRVDKSVASGRSLADAFADAYRLDDDQVRQARASVIDLDRRAGETRRQAVRRAYSETVHLSYLEAEQATRGHLLSREGEARGIDPISLFSGPRSRARRYASEDLLRWWEQHPRQTWTEFAAQVYTGDRAAADRIRLGGNARDFGV